MKKFNRKALCALSLCMIFPFAFACSTTKEVSQERESSPFLSSERVEEPESTQPLPSESAPTVVPDEESSSSQEPSQEEPPAPVIVKTKYAKTTGDNVNIRAGAGTDFAVLGSAEKGTVYAIIGQTGGWYKTYYRGKTAYISASFVSVFSLEKSESQAENAIEEGYKLLGVPYVYGAVRLHDGKGKLLSGFSAQKFDCSSLVQYVFYKGANVLLNVTTRTQVKQGKKVAKSNLQRGDCIYFTNAEREYNTGTERIGHVGIYLGEGYMLHTASDYARIEKISNKRWSYYVEARRFT